MKEIFEVIDARIRNPLFGYFIASLIALNWQSFFFLFIDTGDAASRILYFKESTDISSLLLFPAIIAGIFSLIYPWVNYLFMLMCTKPTELKNSLQAQSEHKFILKKQELEDARAKLLSSAESELIERAKRDEMLDEIGDEEIKEKLKFELEQLRQERDHVRNSTNLKPDYDEYKKLMELADNLRGRADNTNDYEDKEKFRDQAREIEDRAHKLLNKQNA